MPLTLPPPLIGFKLNIFPTVSSSKGTMAWVSEVVSPPSYLAAALFSTFFFLFSSNTQKLCTCRTRHIPVSSSYCLFNDNTLRNSPLSQLPSFIPVFKCLGSFSVPFVCVGNGICILLAFPCIQSCPRPLQFSPPSGFSSCPPILPVLPR